MKPKFEPPEGWEVVNDREKRFYCSLLDDKYIILRKLPPIPEVKSGDWYTYNTGEVINVHCMSPEWDQPNSTKVQEIRFADGRPNWKREG